jgi:DnaJ-class molecular chaperone
MKEEGLVKCRNCYGKRVINFYSRLVNNTKITKFRTVCPRCKGFGTVFWIDEAVGRNRKRRKRQWRRKVVERTY